MWEKLHSHPEMLDSKVSYFRYYFISKKMSGVIFDTLSLRCLLRYFVGRWIERSGILSMWLLAEGTECIQKTQKRELQAEVNYFIFKRQAEDDEPLQVSERLNEGEKRRILVVSSTLYCAEVHLHVWKSYQLFKT